MVGSLYLTFAILFSVLAVVQCIRWGNASDHMNMREGMPTSSFYTGDTKDNRFPPDYEIMVFDEVLKEQNRPAGFYWNHARCHGVAISKERREIVYWAEFW